MAPSGGTITLGINLASGSENANGNGATRNGGTIGGGGITMGGGVGASTSTHCPYLTQLWIFSVNCNEITKGLGLKSCEVCKISNVSPRELVRSLFMNV